MAKGNNKTAADFKAQLCAAADKLRWHMDGLGIQAGQPRPHLLKYISAAFEEKRERRLCSFANPKSEWSIKCKPQRAEAAENHEELSSGFAAGWRNVLFTARLKSLWFGRGREFHQAPPSRLDTAKLASFVLFLIGQCPGACSGVVYLPRF